VEVSPTADHLVALTQWGKIRIDDANPLVRQALERMSLGPVLLENVPLLQEPARRWRTGGPGQAPCPEWTLMKSVLDLLSSCVVHSLGLDDRGRPVLSAMPVSEQATFQLTAIDDAQPIRLS